ncbi:MAG: class I SAM-dependent methyltransferase [Clostridia bacterium]|nr:class I SAM-dependent methyltransferase [Clostridia bacterium]
MKPDYKNWVPKGMCYSFWCGTIISMILFVVFGILSVGISGVWHTVLFWIFLVLGIALLAISSYMQILHNAFDYNGKRKLSKDIVEGVSKYVEVADGDRVLDIGCGSGALAISVAKRNPKARIIGLDRWGKEYASYNKLLCESNAKAEEVNNIEFIQGDATKLPFEDNTFDAITSNYCIHNIPSSDRKKILLELFRVLRKGGTFAIHDIFSKNKYGDMQKFMSELKAQGYENVQLMKTDDKFFKSKNEAKILSLGESAVLVGKK